MKQFFSFVYKETLHILRDRRTLLILFGMPVAQMLIFGFALTNEVKNSNIAVFDPSRDVATRQLIQRFDASRYFDVRSYLQSHSDIEKEFRKGKVRMVVVFPPHFRESLLHGNSATIQLIADASDPNVATTLYNYAGAIIQDYQQDVWQGRELPYTIRTETRMLYNPQLKGAFNFVPGVMSMILLLVCTMMTSVSIVREKEHGTMEVLLASPASPFLVIFAKMVPYFFLSLINIASILLLSVFVLELPIRGSIVLLVGVSMLFIVLSLSLGMLISTSTRSQMIAMFISLVGMFLPTLMLSGFMFPIENMPRPMQVVSNVVPAKWYFIVVKNVMIKGLGISSILRELVILTGMTLFFLLLALKKFKIRLA
ncbi:MAG: ABC transporter permease [Lacibacter sp.]|jgi:ABC-2 type transport system permease protein